MKFGTDIHGPQGMNPKLMSFSRSVTGRSKFLFILLNISKLLPNVLAQNHRRHPLSAEDEPWSN